VLTRKRCRYPATTDDESLAQERVRQNLLVYVCTGIVGKQSPEQERVAMAPDCSFSERRMHRLGTCVAPVPVDKSGSEVVAYNNANEVPNTGGARNELK
jgi:hypothetical protein